MSLENEDIKVLKSNENIDADYLATLNNICRRRYRNKDRAIEALFECMNDRLALIKEDYANSTMEIERQYKDKEIPESVYTTVMNVLKRSRAHGELYTKIPPTAFLYKRFHYNITTDDIAALLDLEVDYVSRNIRQFIKHVPIPTGHAFKIYFDEDKSKILYVRGIDPLRRISLTKKKYLFEKDDVVRFLEKHLKIVRSVEYYDISKIIEHFNDKDPDEVNSLAKDYVSKASKKLDKTIVEKSIDTALATQIINKEVELMRSSSFEILVKHKLLYERHKKALTVAKVSDNQPEVRYLKRKLLSIKNRDYLNIGDLKMANILHYKQIERFIDDIEHTKIYLKLKEDTKKPIVLYAINHSNLEKLYEVEDDVNVITIPAGLDQQNLDNEIIKYITKKIDNEVDE